jgi:iron(III) transport system substrate-binding protein
MSWHEPRENGSGSQAAGYWMLLKNEDWLRQLFEQDLTTTRDNRQQVEWVIHNRYPIALGPGTEAINEFRRNGFDKEITRLEHGTPLGSRLTTGFDNVMLVNRAPHPNAARVYLNWLLSQEGQASWVRITELNSRRLDVGGPPETAPRPGVTYLNNSKEEYLPYIDKAIELAKNVLK